jgi:hypothetical protein
LSAARVLGVVGLAVVLTLLLALIVSNYSLTPGTAKFDLLLTAAIVVSVLVVDGWRLTREFRAWRRQRGGAH